MRTDLAYGRLPDEREDHFLGLEAAHLVGTEALLTTRDNIEAVIEAKAMMCAYGPAGYGKTMAVNSALRALAPDITYRLELRSGPTPRDIRHGLFKALRLPGEPPKRPIEFDALLKNVLAEQFRVLVCDEAQWMSRTGFEFWRHLWDDRHTDIAVVFAGGDSCYRVLRREPMLASRMYIWQEFDRIPKPEVGQVIAAFHPVWATAEPGLIDAVDAEAAHGSFRNWANITHHLSNSRVSASPTSPRTRPPWPCPTPAATAPPTGPGTPYPYGHAPHSSQPAPGNTTADTPTAVGACSSTPTSTTTTSSTTSQPPPASTPPSHG